MQTETRYHMTCGPDGDWRLRSEHPRAETQVYGIRYQPQALAAEQVSPQVTMVTMGEPRILRRDTAPVPAAATAGPIQWIRKIVTPRLRKAEPKSITARGTL